MNGGAADNGATASLCPVCLKHLPARRVHRDRGIYLEKQCPDHGAFAALIWQGLPEMAGWRRPKIPTHPATPGHPVEHGCPFDCGLCPEHRQRSCTILLEVTPRCDLGCPICYAASGPDGADPPVERIATWYRLARRFGPGANIQLSGGEPTLRDDLPELVALGRQSGLPFIQINTNGLRLAREPGYAETLKAAGAGSIFLQFDGVDDTVYRTLRGRPLWAEKQAAVAACARAGLGVVLVPTLVPGVNTHAVGTILETALRWHPTVRGVHFQPISYFGRHPGAPTDEQRLTLPQLMRLMEHATACLFRVDHFRPPGCEHSFCSCHAQYLIAADGRPRPLMAAPPVATPPPIRAEEGAARAIAAVARQWAAPPAAAPTACGCTSEGQGRCHGHAGDLDAFLATARERTFSVSAMVFQDVWNLDLERVQQCCIHIMAPDGRLVPFCLYNLTAADGRPLHRP
ncbi:radical SAM (seleno)protein TrsS [Desulfatitalea alkaliphila]|uniref:Radical SAM protein n=1 Tax=Desulfatitalea alkaliphila TaxID=2929485 RepID=A0AA41UND7_9BACT|nr:radical SAM (seleno)protein TrsS [Desulfatitalea alkaliphila]MCJ8499423.1 radical SAM protein [Desulfatitalea alkaliphila]